MYVCATVAFVRPLDALKKRVVHVGELNKNELFCDDAFLSGATSYRYVAGANGATVQRAVARYTCCNVAALLLSVTVWL